MADTAKNLGRICSGIRTTARPHIGNYHGALKNWVKLQHTHVCFFFAADLHALTTDYAAHKDIASITREMLLDWPAVGLDPNKCTIFVQSQVPAHAELHVLLSMVAPLGWLYRVPTYKDQQQALEAHADLHTYGFLGYPVLQSADIVLYEARYVPVGQDQLSHLELTRELVRRFNHIYGNILKEPEALLTDMPVLPGLDGRKMSKSYNNTIQIVEDPKELEMRLLKMPTDPARVKRTDPGEPEKCPVWALHKVYTLAPNERDWVTSGCRSAGIGCIECKRLLLKHLKVEQQEFSERRLQYAAKPQLIDDIMQHGKAQAEKIANATLKSIKAAVGLTLLRDGD